MVESEPDRFRRVIDNLGHCPRCMRKCAQAMLIGYMVTSVLIFTSAPWVLLAPSTALSTLLTVLWLAHLLTYSFRSSRDREGPGSIAARRKAMRHFLKSLAAMALATAIPAAMQTAWAGNCSVTCPNGTSSSNSCSDPQNCRCYCDGSGNARCDSCV